jgi:phage virion morphogenesis protein
MAGISVTWDSQEVTRALSALARAGRNPGVLLKPLGAVLVRGTRDRFESQVDPEGNPWEPLQPWYAALKRNSRILTESGALLGSVVWEAAGRELAIGSNLIYAGVHQAGMTIRAKTPGGLMIFHNSLGKAWGGAPEVYVPARPFLGISTEDERAVLDQVETVLWRVARL